MERYEIHPLVDVAKNFSDNILRPSAGLIDHQGKVPDEIITEMATLGLLGAILPKEYGGQGIDPLSYGYLTEEIGKGCNSTRALLTVHTSLVGETIVKLGSQIQKEKYLPAMARGEKIACFALSEPEAGSDANAIKTRYEVTENGFRINGNKKWITYSGIADLFLIFAKCEEKVSAFIVEFGVEGLTRKPMSGLMASRGAYLSELNFDNVEIPKESLVGREGEGFSFVANTALYFGRYSIAWAGVAIAHAAMEEMVTYARKRKQFGQKIAQHQLIQGIIADSATAFYAAKAACEKIGHMRNQGDHNAIMETNIAKYNSSAVAMLVANNAVQVLGGNGLSNKYPVERLYREAKVLEIIEGTNQIQQMLISQHALRGFYRKGSVIE
ncbi:acyl-CoA dehydrogenase family protein [Xenorhabdus nematophila]|uniref:3-sulfinopropanoyl-CoA desulfinase n=1 Tax=Xenorhabdus nematophila (strain ATCC 19061 / DSM 3370 / CCUG 14189 / LMG 1036 / NCIMB 9965 / AN6) TaxID=406817 RepID=D3VCB4_XENNA|nr:acyl-CoA dehydrogenase family protein [Xenorhabdus nematophila]CBJ89767.1 Acyl-CoA dehydrogenase involved in xenocoumacin synthesis [Xenorhabdus nematophila ATCC 19061]CEE92516.1 Acyl-CoA dehydrogenase involved in xenocoumacin synthesis [Xenorhabdus nematophila str. Anatoliense]CEE95821.1 Acyl-CoA dehydrogenase involved in xenocoumacin synthesis [Xenorhabdus nematophila str. Anatoliense]CEK22651.1 Acyl-CoA dehydrogenase involved in xenocoumacin synthesis [Xenorhabdus nematophila AN6/1]